MFRVNLEYSIDRNHQYFKKFFHIELALFKGLFFCNEIRFIVSRSENNNFYLYSKRKGKKYKYLYI
jgi:hypothetical protein